VLRLLTQPATAGGRGSRPTPELPLGPPSGGEVGATGPSTTPRTAFARWPGEDVFLHPVGPGATAMAAGRPAKAQRTQDLNLHAVFLRPGERTGRIGRPARPGRRGRATGALPRQR
jgi:hypothetical protein